MGFVFCQEKNGFMLTMRTTATAFWHRIALAPYDFASEEISTFRQGNNESVRKRK